MDTDTLNENVFDMPDDIQEAENRVQRHNEGRRLALVRLLSINNNETVFRSDREKTDQVLICEAAISTYERDRIMQQEKEIGNLQGEIAGLKSQLERAKAGNMPLEAPRESNDDVNACLRVIRLMVIQNEQLQSRRPTDEASRLEDALVSNLRQGLGVESVRLEYQGGIDPKNDYFIGHKHGDKDSY